MLRALCAYYLILQMTLWNRYYYYLHFINEETDKSYKVIKQDWNLSLSDSRVGIFNPDALLWTDKWEHRITTLKCILNIQSRRGSPARHNDMLHNGNMSGL